MIIDIRHERPDDIPAIRDVNDRAFGQDLEGRLVDALRSNGAVLASLVATLEGRIIGHIMYSPATIGTVSGAGLAPMAVVPEYQRRGVGSSLVEAGNLAMQQARCPFIVVLGHPLFYPRFGFERASAHRITCAWDVPDDVFMVKILDEASMRGVSGPASYRPELSTVSPGSRPPDP